MYNTPITIELLIAHGYYPNDKNKRVNSQGLDDVNGKYTLHYAGNNGLWILFDNDMGEWLILIDNKVIKALRNWEQFQALYLGLVGEALTPITINNPAYSAILKKLQEI